MSKEKVKRQKAKATPLVSLLFAFALLPFAFPAWAAAPPAVKRVRASDQLDYVFFASDAPVLIRMHVRIGDKPYFAAHDAWLDKLFTWFDKDGDGFLNATEAGRLVQANVLSGQVQGAIGNRGAAVPFATLDTNKDGKVSKEEFRDYYRKNGLSPLRFSNNNNPAATAKQTNDSIYKRLEIAPTGKLTQEKLARFPDLLRTLDENEDELLTVQELGMERPNSGVYASPPRSGPMAMRPVAPDMGLIEIPPGTLSTPLALRLVNFYDKDKDGKLARKEIGFDRALFDKLDANHDGFLDAGELARFFDREPDLVFRGRVGRLGSVVGGVIRFGLSLGKKGLAPDRAEVLDAKGRPMAKKVNKVNGETLAFSLGDARFDLQVSEGQTNNGRLFGVRQFYLNQYDALAEKKGYVDRSQEKANMNGQFQYLFFLFPQADKNADGKLKRKELEAYLDLTGEGGACFVTVQVNDYGRNLFNVLDANGDGRLSIREMRTAWQRVKPLCKDSKSLIQTDLPRSLRIQMMQGSFFNRGFASVAFTGGTMTAGRPRTSGPLPTWFVKMDRNSDGDISPKEWLGTEEEFRAIDADGDGLISGEEAKQFEARRKAKEKKPDPAKKPVAVRK